MLTNNMTGIIGSESNECKPDPEAMLQNARKKVEDADHAIKLWHELDTIPIYLDIHFPGPCPFLTMLGALQKYRMEWLKVEAQWLEEIDSEPEL